MWAATGEVEDRAWPTLAAAAFHGPIGQAVRLLTPLTEADPAAILAQLLAGLGAVIGSGPHARAGHRDHPARLSVVAVGETAKSRKGTSWAAARLVLDQVAPVFTINRVMGGFGSGEAVVDELRDETKPDADGKGGDPGTGDKRLLVYEAEFARVLRVAGRETSLLSQILRLGWDGDRLETRARSKTAIATGHHLVVVGHITAEELRRNLTETEAANGFANRILWVCARRQALHPYDDDPPDRLNRVARTIMRGIEATRPAGRVHFSDAARPVWERLYAEMADDDPGGLLGAIVARPEPQTLRLALTYTLVDGCSEIEPAHLDAGYAVWRYCRASAAHIFGDAIGDEIADRLLAALRRAGDAGLTTTQQSDLFSRHMPAGRLLHARAELERRGLIVTTDEDTGGRKRRISRHAKKAN